MNAAPPTPRIRAEVAQRAASDPGVSAFVSASAGSGKTKLLTDRLLRLMLAGAEPGRIQCLTFTRAGAAEMAVRLQSRLGAWATAPDAVLDDDLRRLDVAPDAATRDAARQLFARVLDLPGGMRIETIHAFCQSLLRRFPIEAQLSPHFQLLDDAAARDLQGAAREAVLGGGDAEAAIATLAPEVSLDQFAGLLRALQNRRERLDAALADGPDALEAAQRRILGLKPGDSEQGILRAALAAMDLPRLRAVLRQVQDGAGATIQAKLPEIFAWLQTAPPEQPDGWHVWARYFLRQDQQACHHKYLVSAATERTYPGTRDFLLAEQALICATIDKLKAARVAELSAALMRLAIPALTGYDARKASVALLDYADLIARARALLRIPGAAWVLYKLDGGLDHLLLDEVQDTAPDQWRIADALTAEFFAGEGARATDPPRSIFAVGDHKQSIFSFQGAAPEEFERWRDILRDRTRQGGGEWRDVPLEVSFRSTTPVLALVDAVFRDAARLGITDQPALNHIADRADHAGRVELWPLAPRPEKPPAVAWEPPASNREVPTAPQLLANELAGWIAGQLAAGAQLESRGRALHAGDILVLVRSRGAFDRALLRALKAKGVPVAGLDRMILTEQPAVADLLALCDALLLPSDELALATVLTSPLGGLTDDSLMQLALGRKTGLWETLHARAGERPDWRAAHDFLATLFARVDTVTPHALLTQALGPLGGRARLFARLGPQAAEPIDELLSVAIAYGQTHPPSLQGLLHWLRQSSAEVKRQAEGAGDTVRIMTVHGAKGLQAPLVILPASTGLSDQRSTLLWARDPEGGPPVPLWGPRRDTHDAVMRQTLEETIDLERQEHYRLLYVALTRAEDRLLVCGWQTHKSQQDCWYEVVRDAFAQLPGVASVPFPAWSEDGVLLRHETPQRAPPDTGRAAFQAEAVTLPAWAGAGDGWRPTPPPHEPALPASLAPSRPADAALGPVPAAAPPLALRGAADRRFRRGQILHSLLQHLPNLPPADRAAAARAYLARPQVGGGIAPGQAADLADEIMTLLDDPALAPLFGPGSRAEVPLTGVVQTPTGPAVIGGLIDRLAVLPDRILVADYKTNREPPARAAETPALYLGQMAAYRAVLRAIHPDRPVQCVLIWTRAARADWLDDALLDAHAPRAHIPSQ